MSDDQNKTLMEMNEVLSRFKGVAVNQKRGGRFRFRLHLTPSMAETPIETLDLSVRGFHCLKRAGFDTIGRLAKSIEAGNELSKIRNCGKNTIQEIMIRLFLFQYYSYAEEKREKYLLETIVLNKGSEVAEKLNLM